MGGFEGENFTALVGSIRETGKRHRMVIPYIDENGVMNSPVFGISSLTGQAIKDWTTTLYGLIINYDKSKGK